MKQSLLIFSAWISLALLTAVSCRSPGMYVSGEKSEKASASLSRGSFEKLTFKARLIYKEKEITGLIILKHTGDGTCKIAFFNELGLSYLEATYNLNVKRQPLTIYQLTPFLDHPVMIRNLENSFRSLFSHDSYEYAKSPEMNPEESEIIRIDLHNGFILEMK